MNDEYYYFAFALPAWILPAIMGALLVLVGMVLFALVRKRRRP